MKKELARRIAKRLLARDAPASALPDMSPEAIAENAEAVRQARTIFGLWENATLYHPAGLHFRGTGEEMERFLAQKSAEAKRKQEQEEAEG